MDVMIIQVVAAISLLGVVALVLWSWRLQKSLTVLTQRLDEQVETAGDLQTALEQLRETAKAANTNQQEQLTQVQTQLDAQGHQLAFTQALFTLAHGSRQQALEQLQRAAEQGVADPASVVLLAEELLRDGRSEEVEQLLGPYLADEGEPDAEILLVAGALRRELGHWDQALELHKQALAQGAEAGLCHNEIGLDHMAAGAWNVAVEAFRAALQPAPDEPEPMFNLGLALFEQGEDEESLRWLRRAVEHRPERVDWCQALARVLLDNGMPEAARELLERVIVLAPQNGAAWAELAQARRECQDLEQAAQSARLAVQLAPEHFRAWLEAGLAEFEGGLADQALAALQRAHQIAPDSVEVMAALAQVSEFSGARQEALQYWKDLVQLAPERLESRLHCAQLLEDAGDSAAAVNLLEAGLEYGRRQGELLLALARAQLASGWLDSAGKTIEKLTPILHTMPLRLAGAYLSVVLALMEQQGGELKKHSDRILHIIEMAPDSLPMESVRWLEPGILAQAKVSKPGIEWHEHLVSLLSGEIDAHEFEIVSQSPLQELIVHDWSDTSA